MAIEPLVIDNRPGLLNNRQANSNVSNEQSSLLDRIKEQRDDEDKKKVSEKESEQRSDRVSLSQSALEALSSRETSESDNRQVYDPTTQAAEQSAIRSENQLDFASRLKRTQELAVELKGIGEYAKNNNLTEAQSLRSASIRSEVSNLLDNSEASVELVNDIAGRAINDAREDVAPILSKISSGGSVTGDEFSKINDANRLLNKANGFGLEGFEDINTKDKKRLEELKQQSSTFLEGKGDETLTPNELDYVQRLQQEISSIEGFRLSIKDTVGPEGVVI